jgi:hypothetical protein
MNAINEKLVDFPLRKALYDRFGSKLSDETSEYSANEADLKAIYEVVNEVIFESKLIADVEIRIIDRTNEIAKGTIVFKIDNATGKIVPLIKIIREEKYDTMVSMVNVICHEMIHEFDILYGPISKMKEHTVKLVGARRMIGEYDVHGDYFNQWMKIIINAGMIVSTYQPDKVKIKFFKEEDFMDENEQTKLDITQKKKVEYDDLCRKMKMMYDAVKSDDVLIVEVTKDYTYILMS